MSNAISASAFLQVDLINPPDLTDTLRQDKKRIIGHGSFGTVYSCLCARNGEVAVKAITLPRDLEQTEMDSLLRKVRRELEIWRRLDHPNIVPLLGTARGSDFGSDHPCLVAVWMPNGTLFDYVKRHGTKLLSSSRVELIRGAIAGLEYLHSHSVVHGNLHPGNVLIDGNNNVRLAGFGFSHTLGPVQEKLSHLWTNAVRAGALMWSAPELLYPKLYPDLKAEAMLSNDIYSFGSIILFILSGKFPWSSIAEMESNLKEFNNPPRPVLPPIPDGVWDFIERCWSPQSPSNRPSAKDVLLFSGDKLEQLLQPNLTSDINVVLFGALGCGKSSIVNLLAGHPIAQVSPNVTPCTKLPQWYRITIGRRRLRLWDTMGFYRADEGDSRQLLPYEQAYSFLRNLSYGIDLILLCARKDRVSASLGNLYRLLNDVFYEGRAPIAVVITHFDCPDEGWWGRNQEVIAQRTGIPVRSIPYACITTDQIGRDQSKRLLEALLEGHATGVAPAFLRLGPSLDTLRIATCCGLSRRDIDRLLKEFGKPRRPANVIFFGKVGAGKSSVINLIAGHPVAKVGSGPDPCTSDFRSYDINVGARQFQFWDTTGFGSETYREDLVRSRAAIAADQLVHRLFSDGGIDLLVFVKMCGKLTQSELNCYRFFREVLCGGQIPVAFVVTCVDPMESWWETNGRHLIETLKGNIIGHACIASQTSDAPEDSLIAKRLEESRLSVEAMLEDCISLGSMPARRLRFGFSRVTHEREDEIYQRRAPHSVLKRMTG